MSGQLALFSVDTCRGVDESWNGQCSHCDATRQPTVDDPFGIDPCLGLSYLADVAHACCGHGEESKAYVVISPGCAPLQSCDELPDRIVLKGREALDYFRSLGVGPKSA